MSRKYKTPRFVTILILTSITVFFWVAFEIYWAFTREPDIDVPASVLRPLNPELDLETLSAIGDTIYLNEQEIGTTTFFEPQDVDETGAEGSAEQNLEPTVEIVETEEEATNEASVATGSAEQTNINEE